MEWLLQEEYLDGFNDVVIAGSRVVSDNWRPGQATCYSQSRCSASFIRHASQSCVCVSMNIAERTRNLVHDTRETREVRFSDDLGMKNGTDAGEEMSRSTNE